MNRLTLILCAAPFLGLLPGCGGGAFHQAVTSDMCHPGDANCSRSGFDAPLALGGTMSPQTKVELEGSAGPSIHYESAAPSILDVSDGVVTGRQEGSSALMFVTDGSTVLDFLHVWVKKPTALRLVSTVPGREGQGPVEGAIELMTGEELRIDAQPIAGGQGLLGSGPAEWSIEPAIAEALREGSENRRRIVATRPGKAVLHVRMLGVETSIDLVVHATADGAPVRHVATTKGGAT